MPIYEQLVLIFCRSLNTEYLFGYEIRTCAKDHLPKIIQILGDRDLSSSYQVYNLMYRKPLKQITATYYHPTYDKLKLLPKFL